MAAISVARGAATLATLGWLVAASSSTGTPAPTDGAPRMSFHNRLLLNRAVIAGLRTIEVLVVTSERLAPGLDPMTQTAAAVTRLGGRVLRTQPDLGYLRIELPLERLAELGALDSLAAYQISSLSRGAWYRDGPPLSNAQMFRGFETAPVVAAVPQPRDALPELTAEQARAPGYTGDDPSLAAWMRDHPTYDGRGVTIALVESALPSFTEAALRNAKTLDGRDIPKIAGILNVIDPRNADETRVRLEWTTSSKTAWTRVAGRTYILPAPGTYRFGILDVPAGGHVVQRFALAERQGTLDLWLDTNGDGSFQDERPLADVNERFEPRLLTLRHPQQANVSFVMSRGCVSDIVHIYLGRSSHQSMTASVAAGGGAESLARGVAPNARLLFVRKASSEPGLSNTFEAFIAAARDRRVDVISVSGGFTLVPDAATEFASIFFSRLVRAYGKPVFNAAGNTSQTLGSVHAYGDTVSAGGIISSNTYATLYGGRPIDRTIVHPISAAGPAIDGAIKPDFLVPMERLASDVPWNRPPEPIPRSAPARRIPSGYQISCCTSATSPYAAGVAALLISAARQAGVPYSAASLARAMTTSAALLPDVPAHLQGNGLLDVGAAWRALSHDAEPVRIFASTSIAHPLAQYMTEGPRGVGLFEFQGWFAGTKGQRTITLRRASGIPRPMTYHVSWLGDETFRSAASITLPLEKNVPLEVDIEARTAGAHSALLQLTDPDSGAVVFRSQATVAAAERPNASGAVHVTGIVPHLQQRTHYLHVPTGTAAIAFDLQVTRGVVGPTILRSHGLSGDYYPHVHPMNTFFAGPGRYSLVMPNPEPGTWTFKVDNRSVWLGVGPEFGPRDDTDAEYVLTVRMLGAIVRTRSARGNRVSVDVINNGSRLQEPVLEIWPGALASQRGTFRQDGLPQLFEVLVPTGTAALRLRVDSAGAANELYLYDCTSGECFSYDIGFPAAASHTLLVRKPAAGRWVAAVNSAPVPTAAGSFRFETVMTAGSPAIAPIRREGTDRWHADVAELPPPASLPGEPILFVQLLDRAAERGQADHPWSTAPHYVQLRDRPVAIGVAIHRR